MPLVTLRNVNLGYGGKPLIENANLVIEDGDRICLIGRNGAGKSTLLKLIEQDMTAETGQVERTPLLSTAKLIQDIPQNFTGTIFDIVAEGLGEAGKLMSEHEHIAHQLAHDDNPKLLDQLHHVQQKLTAINGWAAGQEVSAILSKMSLSPETDVSSLSGGMIRRVLMAKAIVATPDILLLDEPTNHLDIEAIIWLEKFLLSYNKTIIFITHDRSLLQKIATRIIEIDNGRLLSWDGDYESYLTHKENLLAAEAKADQEFDKKLALEEKWIRQGIKARRTRNEGRVRALKKLRAERQERRVRPGQVKLEKQSIDQSGKIVFEADNINYSYAERPVIQSFSSVIMRGDKIGIIGPNGCGKSTLLRLLLGELEPQSGTAKHGTNLSIGYFDQRHMQLDENLSVMDNVYDSGEFIVINDKPIHILSYLQDFLFSPERARQKVKALSGGERNRLLLARLFTKPSNVLVLDEPTNDLDMETLELLEEKLLDYDGTLLLVSHDRAFLNNVVTSTIVFEGDGVIDEYVGGYDDYLRQRPDLAALEKAKITGAKVAAKEEPKKSKLSYKEQRELEQLPAKIETLEKEQEQLFKTMSDSDFYKNSKEKIAEVQDRIETIKQELVRAYARWETLERISKQ